MAALDSHFSTFINGGDLIPGDTVVGLRNGLNTKFNNTGGVGTFLPLAGGTMSGTIDMDGNAIINLPAPSNPLDASNKAYVDSAISGVNPLTTKGDLFTFSTANARLAVGTVNGQMLQVNSATATGLAWSTASYPTVATSTGSFIYANGTNFVASTSLWPNTVGSAGKMIRSDGTINAYSTATFADTYAINTLLYNASANTVTGLASAADSVLITSAGSVPSLSQTLPTAVQDNITRLGAQAEALNMNTQLINNVVDPVSAQDAATKRYVDQTALNGTSVYAASAASLGTVTQSGAGVGATLTNAGVQATFALDGVTPPVGADVLIKDTAVGMVAANEGIYTISNAGSGATNWVLTRATTYDTPTEINQTGLILIRNGSTLAGQAWYNAATIVTVDTTAFSYSQFGNIIFPLTLSQGGTNASLVASNGGIVYSTATAMAILAGTATAGQMLRSGASSAPSWSTATFPATATGTGTILRADGTNWVATTATFANTYGASELLYSNGANTVAGLTVGIDSVLISSHTGVPSWLANPAATGRYLQSNSGAPCTWSSFVPASSGANSDITSMTGLTGTLRAPTGVTSSAGLPLLGFTYTASAVNYFQFLNNTTGSNPAITAQGSDSDITMQINGKGTGGVYLMGVSTNSSAVAGQVGEYKSTTVATGSAVSVTTDTATNVATLSLEAGDWDVRGVVVTKPAAGTTTTAYLSWISTTSAALPATLENQGSMSILNATVPANAPIALPCGMIRISLAATTTVYLSTYLTFAVSTMGAYGFIGARRVR